MSRLLQNDYNIKPISLRYGNFALAVWIKVTFFTNTGYMVICSRHREGFYLSSLILDCGIFIFSIFQLAFVLKACNATLGIVKTDWLIMRKRSRL